MAHVLDFAPAPRREAAWRAPLGLFLAVVVTLALLSQLPEPSALASDPTPSEVWRGNAASFAP